MNDSTQSPVPAAVAGMMAQRGWHPDLMAGEVYKYADAMLERRQS